MVQDAVTTVGHSPGATSLTLTHAGLSYSGTVDTAGNFQTSSRTVVVSPARYDISVTGRFTVSGLEAPVTVDADRPHELHLRRAVGGDQVGLTQRHSGVMAQGGPSPVCRRLGRRGRRGPVAFVRGARTRGGAP